MGEDSGNVRGRKSSKAWEPLLQGGTAPHSWIIVPPWIEESFLERWFSALSENEEHHKKMHELDGYWEYQEAVADLNRNCSLFCQRQDAIQNPPPIHFQLFLWRELQAYGRHLNRVVNINRALRECSEALATAQTHSQRIAVRARLGSDLGPMFEQVDDARFRIREVEKDYWDRVFCVGSFTSEYADEDPDLHFHEMKMRRLSESLHFPTLKQERNLDSTFQIRVGDLLRKYGTNPYVNRLTLLTISRLVLLVYICAELALDVENNLTIWGSDPPRTLSIDKTYETLRDAGLR